MTDSPDLDIRVLESCAGEPLQGLRRLFSLVFGSEVSEAHWRWKYGGPTGSRSLHVVACSSGEPIGHVGVLVQPAWRAGPAASTAAWMAHLTDVMVHPGHRGGLDHQGVYPRIMEAMAERLAQWQTEDGAPLYAYGFPGLTPSRLGHRMGLYRPLYRVREHPLAPVPSPGWLWRLVPAEPGALSPRQQAELDALDRTLARTAPTDSPPRLRKGADYLQWRYGAHPAGPYRLHVLRDPLGRLRGWRVTRAEPRAVVIDARVHPSVRRSRLWAGLAGADPASSVAWCSWTAEEGSGAPQDSLIVPVEFRVPGPTQGWPAPVFMPGDTDVF